MKTLQQAAQEHQEKEQSMWTGKGMAKILQGEFLAGAEWANRWISVDEELPDRGKIVLVRGRDKNKEDGIWLYDIVYFEGENWSEQKYTWETITHWKYIENDK